MSSFLAVAPDRATTVPTGAPPTPAPPTAAALAAAVDACRQSEAALEAGDAEEALVASEYALCQAPTALAWMLRMRAQFELSCFADVLASVPRAQADGAPLERAAQAQAALQSLFDDLPRLMAGTASGDRDESLTAWQELAEADPTSLQARSTVYAAWLQQAARMRDDEADPADDDADATTAEEDGPSWQQVVAQAVACLRESAADAAAFIAAEAPPADAAAPLAEFLARRRPNVPLSAFGDDAGRRAAAALELSLGLGLSMAGEASDACAAYSRSAAFGGATTRLFILWSEAASGEATGCVGVHSPDAARRAAAAAVYRAGVAAGVWAVPDQRPAYLIPGLAAAPWHDPQSSAVCRRLKAEYSVIRAEALALLRQDGGGDDVFTSYTSKALKAGDWADVGLYYNGMRNTTNAARAPLTSALLGSDEGAGALRRDATSCSLGSAYFSLLRPRTRLQAHCGPTNARLRAHLGLVVPEAASGACDMAVGGEARRWEEGEVLLFDDSFEHEVRNDTDSPRLVLIVDLWHPELAGDEARLGAMQHEAQRAAYRGVVERGEYEATTLRGH